MEKVHFFILRFTQNNTSQPCEGVYPISITKSDTWNKFIKKFKHSIHFTCALIFSYLIPSHVLAHAFGQRYDLPLPLWLFVSGGALTVMISFVIIALFTHPAKKIFHKKFNILGTSIGSFLIHPMCINSIRSTFLAIFLLIVTTGFCGSQNPLNNLSIVMTWVIAWVGLAFICALLGNFWALINPWNTIFLYLEIGYAKLTGNNFPIFKEYPAKLGYWPACIFFFCFAWLEINWSASNTPSAVASAISIYSALTFLGMLVYGRETWLKYGECFSLVYELFSKFSISEGRISLEKKEWFLRPPGIGLLIKGSNPPKITLVFFILLLLSTVTFDGFTETETFQQISLSYNEYLKTETSQKFYEFAEPLFDTIALLSFPLIFITIYGFFIWLGAFMDEETQRTIKLARIFIYSILPISIAYHLSHYISLLAIEGQLAIRLISDPFGFGWDLFNTSAYKTDITIINAKFVWYFSVILIVVGHIIAVFIAHMEAMRIFADRPQGRYGTLISQIPMIVLMIGYTMLSLWIIAQPIVG